MKRKRIILLTGFEPFGGHSVNPSIQACRRIQDKRFSGYTVKVEEIPLRLGEIKGIIEGLIEKHAPSAVICTGQGGGSWINLERVAINIADVSKSTYNCGAKPRDLILEVDGPAAYFTRLPIRNLLEKLRTGGVPCEISNSAGTFGCNQIFYHLLHYVERNNLDIQAGFIHVPMLPEQVVDKREPSMHLDLIHKALEIVLNELTSSLNH